MRPTLRPIRSRGGFTLIELLVVIVIIGLISATALPVVLPALNERRVSEGARVVQAVLAGTRDAAIRANAPRGVRLLPDPLYNFANNAAGGPLASNRFVAIEPAPPYGEGAVNGYVIPASNGFAPDSTDPTYTASLKGFFTPSPALLDANNNPVQYLRVQSNEVVAVSGAYIPQVPTGWQFNIRQGDKIRFNDSGAYYTVAGPIHGKSITANPERYICYKPIGTLGNGSDTEAGLYGDGASRLNSGLPLEYLNLTNGIDDDGDGWIDESCDGIDNDGDGIIDPGNNGIDDDGNGIIDEPAELLFGYIQSGPNAGTFSPYAGSEYEVEKYIGVLAGSPPSNLDYTIVRRPVVSPNAIETTLPEGVVIDLTTWNAPARTPQPTAANPSPIVMLPERSRLPVDPFSGYVDIMIDQSGRVVPLLAGGGSNIFASASPLATIPFYHFWVTERDDIVAPLFGSSAMYVSPQATTTSAASFLVPNANPNYGNLTTSQNYLLPMPKGTVDVNKVAFGGPFLKAQRRLVTVFTKTGQIVANSIESFSVNDTSAPYYDAQNGTKESL